MVKSKGIWNLSYCPLPLARILFR
jgi:alpha-ribazole phosphatase